VLQLLAIIWIPFLLVPVWMVLASIGDAKPRRSVATV
jgi:hypothetical protein